MRNNKKSTPYVNTR